MRQVTLQVESGVEAPGESRTHLASLRPSLGARYDDVLLIVSELVTNSVRHSTSNGIGIRVECWDSQIRVEVSDEGPGFDRDGPRGDGLGLTIIDNVADRWGLSSGDRFTVWAELSRRPA